MSARSLDLPSTDPDATVDFLTSWQGLLPPAAGGGHRWTSITQLPRGVAYADDLTVLTESIKSRAASLEELMYPPDAGAKRQGLYHAVGVTKQRPPQGKRGNAQDVDAIPGAWADFDVSIEEGKFAHWDHVLEVIHALDSLGVGPQIVVATGSGGAHAYWRFEGGLSPESAIMYSSRIRQFITANHGVKIDNVAQANRVMRLPGSIRFPKNPKDPAREPVMVTMLRNKSVYTDPVLLTVVTQPSWDVLETAIREQRSRVTEDWDRAVAISREELAAMSRHDAADGIIGHRRGDDDAEGTWSSRYRNFAFEAWFNAEVSWAQVLEPMGWVRFGEPDAQGRQSWTRPGGGKKNPRSAVTDWEGSPHVMSLLSDAPETGLSHLYTLADFATERRHKLTKVRVAAELYAGGSIERLIRVWMRGDR